MWSGLPRGTTSQTRAGRYIQVIYVMESEADIDYAEVDVTELDPNEEAFYVIHARPLTPAERHNYKQRRSR